MIRVDFDGFGVYRLHYGVWSGPSKAFTRLLHAHSAYAREDSNSPVYLWWPDEYIADSCADRFGGTVLGKPQPPRQKPGLVY